MKKCPLIQKKCMEHDCHFYTHLVGMNPQSGQPTDEWGCAVAWLPLLLVENAEMSRKVAASVDRNNNTFFAALPLPLQQRVMAQVGNNGNPSDQKTLPGPNNNPGL
jgi:hypothetical protein